MYSLFLLSELPCYRNMTRCSPPRISWLAMMCNEQSDSTSRMDRAQMYAITLSTCLLRRQRLVYRIPLDCQAFSPTRSARWRALYDQRLTDEWSTERHLGIYPRCPNKRTGCLAIVVERIG